MRQAADVFAARRKPPKRLGYDNMAQQAASASTSCPSWGQEAFRTANSTKIIKKRNRNTHSAEINLTWVPALDTQQPTALERLWQELSSTFWAFVHHRLMINHIWPLSISGFNDLFMFWWCLVFILLASCSQPTLGQHLETHPGKGDRLQPISSIFFSCPKMPRIT